MMSPYHSVQISTQRRIWLWCLCWQQRVPNRYIKIKFNIGYFQWYKKTAELDEQNFVLIHIEHWLVFDARTFFIGTEICRTKTFSSSRISKRKTCFHLEFLKLELIDQIFFFKWLFCIKSNFFKERDVNKFIAFFLNQVAAQGHLWDFVCEYN